MIYPIRYFGDPVLRRRAGKVTRFGAALDTLVASMLETMYDANGVGLAAPQIGLSRRLFVALETGPTDDDEEGDEGDTIEDKRRRWGVIAEHAMVNPRIVERSGSRHGQDGCLSLPGLFVEALERSERVRIRYQDTEGAWHERDAEGHFAHVLQHELDHLDGVLFFDRLPPAEREAFLANHRSEMAEFQREAKRLLKAVRREQLPLPAL